MEAFSLAWNEDKSRQLLLRHGVAFEDVAAVPKTALLHDGPHFNLERYPNQRQLMCPKQ